MGNAESQNTNRVEDVRPEPVFTERRPTSVLGKIIKEKCWLCVNQDKFIKGNISVVNQLIIFEPSPDDKFAKVDGLLAYQFCLDVRDVSDCGEVGHVNQVINMSGGQGPGETPGKRAKRGGGMTYLQIFWQRQEKDRQRGRGRGIQDQQQTLFLVPKKSVEVMIDTIRLFIDGIDANRKKGISVGTTHLTSGPVASSLGHMSPTKLFKIASDARGGSPSPPPVIGIKGVICGKREVDNRAISIHTPIFVGGESKILSTDNVLNIEATLPQQQRGYNWQLSYGSSSHGLNWVTFYRCVKQTGPNLLVIKTTKGDIIGGYASESWNPCGEYIGTGESFVFRCHQDAYEKFSWTLSDPYFMLATSSSLVMGGGGGYAFRLDEKFNGYSCPCDTFGTTTSLTANENFEVFEVELFSFISGTEVDKKKTGESFDFEKRF